MARLEKALRRHAIEMGRRVRELGGGLTRVAADVRGRFDSAALRAAAEFMADQAGDPASAGDAGRRRTALRNHPILRTVLSGAYDELARRGREIVLEDQAKAYTADQVRLARLFNGYTKPEIRITAEVTDAELQRLRRMPVEGLTVAEWAVRITDRWFDSMTQALMTSLSGEKGEFAAGLVTLSAKVDAAFGTWTQSMRRTAHAAGSVALRESGRELHRAFARRE